MSYDRDIRWIRRFAWVLFAGNLGAGVWNAYAHLWINAIACFIWVFNSYLVLMQAAMQQKTRDLGRTIEAGLHAMRREMEHEE